MVPKIEILHTLYFGPLGSSRVVVLSRLLRLHLWWCPLCGHLRDHPLEECSRSPSMAAGTGFWVPPEGRTPNPIRGSREEQPCFRSVPWTTEGVPIWVRLQGPIRGRLGRGLKTCQLYCPMYSGIDMQHHIPQICLKVIRLFFWASVFSKFRSLD